MNDEVRYEHRDVRFTPLVLSIAGLLALVAVAAGAMATLFASFAERTNRRPAVNPPSAMRPALARELHELRQREEQLLGSYGWVSRQDGIVRVPIERAMEMILAEENANP
jgi:hypothetical protein